MELELIYETKKSEAQKAINSLWDIRMNASIQLQKMGAFLKHLSPAQMQSINGQFEAGSYLLEEIEQRLMPLKERYLPPLLNTQLPSTVKPLKHISLKRIAATKKAIFQFSLICSRAMEISDALKESLQVFECQYKNNYRKLFPLGIFSRLWRSIRAYFNYTYFNWRDLAYLRNIGAAAGFVLKMAEAPLI